jgi:hypothetical protein
VGVYSQDQDTLTPGLGNEIDLTVEWEYSDNVYFTGTLAVFMPNGDYAESDMATAALGKVRIEF